MNFADFTRRTLGLLLGVVAPDTCCVCDRALSVGEDELCLHCLAELPRTWYHRQHFNELHKRLGTSVPLDVAAGWFFYNRHDRFAQLIRTAKYADRPRLARRAGALYGAELAADGVLDSIDVLLPVPMHWWKRVRRGYNQAEEVARGIASQGRCVVGQNLIAVRGHSTQTHLTGEERRSNIKNIFEVLNPEELKGKHVAVVDDVITTGATISECVRTLLSGAHPSRVSVLSLGVTIKP